MKADRIALLSNPYAGCGREKVLELTHQAFECLQPQISEIMVGPGDMGEVVCQGDNVTVLGQDSTHTRRDTIETARQMIERGAELFVIVSGDGTYNDALEGMKSVGATVPIFGIAGGRFNTIYPRRKHDPFVSMRDGFRPFSIEDLVVEDVMGLISRINGEIVSYGFFWATVANALAYSDDNGNVITIDAAKALKGEIVPLPDPPSIASEATRIVVHSNVLGEIELASGRDISMPIVAHVVDEINQIMAGEFGALANIMGLHGVAYYFPDTRIKFIPTPDLFPVDIRSVGFFEGDQVRFTNLNDGSVFQVDSTPICQIGSDDVLTVEVVLKLGQKAVVKPY